MWRRTSNSWGYSPLEQVNRRNVAQLKLVWTRPLTQGDQEGTPLVHDGIMYFPNPADVTQALRRGDRRVHLGVSAQLPDGSRRVLPRSAHQSQSRDLRQPHSRQRCRRLRLRTRREDRQARLGNLHSRLQARRQEQLGPDRRGRQGDLGPQLRARRRAGRLRAHGVRREDGQGSVALPHDSEARRARRRELGRHPVRASAGTSACGWCRATTPKPSA